MINNSVDVSAIVLTYNEEIHIRRCIDNLLQLTDQIFVIDCFSTDKTVEIAKEMGVFVLQHKWENNYAKQFNWALDNCLIKTKWVLRLDADEYLMPETIEYIRKELSALPDDVTSLSLSLARIWMGRTIHFGTGKVILKRLFQYKIGRCEERLMDEHIQTSSGRDLIINYQFADDNLNDILWWSHKHVNYAVREAFDLLDIELNLLGNATNDSNKEIGQQASQKRKTKHRYSTAPLFWRAFAYFIYRYILRLGFLEGKEGFCWHFFQGLWYRMLVDATVFEIKKRCGNDPETIRNYISDHYHIALK